MKNIISYYRNEQGNVVLFVIGMLGIMMVLFILVVNLSSALATKQQSETTVSQASLAATSAFYEEVRRVITGFSYPEPIPPTEPDPEANSSAWEAYREALKEYEEKLEVYKFFTLFDNYVASAKTGLTGLEYRDWSDKELELQAFDIVINGALTNGRLLQEIVEGLLVGNNSIQQAAITMGILTIEKNGGILEEATLDIRDNRIEIRAATEATSTAYDGFVESVTEKLYQESSGPKIDFINLIWTKTLPVYLEYE